MHVDCPLSLLSQASFAHEVGLVLGLAQPNAPGHANFAVTSPLNASNCGADAALLPGQPRALASAAPVVKDSWAMMDMLLTRKVRRCCGQIVEMQSAA